MKSQKSTTQTVLATAIALTFIGGSTSAFAAKDDMEKCYGIVKAGKNDCKTATNSCVGHAEKDGDANAFLVVPKGTCDKIVGGSKNPKA